MPHMKTASWRVTAFLAAVLGLVSMPVPAGEIVVGNLPLSARAQAAGRPVTPPPPAQPSYARGVPVQERFVTVRATPSAYAQGSSGYANQPGGYSVSERVEDWKNYGGARVYWRALTEPRQLRTGGVAFIDPASWPPLFAPEQKARQRRRAAARRAAARTPAPSVQKAPEGISSTRLRVPAAPPVAPPSPQPAPGRDGTASVPLRQQAVPQRRAAPPKVTTEVWNPVAPVTAAVTPPLPFLKGN